MDVGTSKGLESFLAFLRETTERHRMAEADRAEAEAATQDLLHALELGDDKAPGRARLGLKIREVRRQRRTGGRCPSDGRYGGPMYGPGVPSG